MDTHHEVEIEVGDGDGGRNEGGARTIVGCAIAFIGAVALGLTAIIGSFAIGGAGAMHRQAVMMERGVEVDATVLTSEVEEVRFTHGGGQGARRSTSVRYVPAIRYAYEFDGRPYQSEAIFPFPRNGDSAWARSFAARYPAGATVTAWIDPEEPVTAFLVREWVLGPYALLVSAGVAFGLLMSMASLVTFLWPRISTGAAVVGLSSWLLLLAWAGLHYWLNARGPDAGFGTPEILGLVALLFAPLPLLARRVGTTWKRKLDARA